MSHRFLVLVCVWLSLLLGHAVGQTPSSAAKAKPAPKWTPPRTQDGHPDLQGIWTTATLTPLERPPEFAGKPVLTPAEAAAFEKQLVQQDNRDRRDGSGGPTWAALTTTPGLIGEPTLSVGELRSLSIHRMAGFLH